MDVPIVGLMDEQACYDQLVHWLHPQGLTCPRCQTFEHCYIHKRDRVPILDYRCKACGRCFNAFTQTLWHGTYYSPVQIVLILRGFAQGVPTAQLSREVGVNRGRLTDRRHQLQALAAQACPADPLADATVEVDEAYVNAGEKRCPAQRPERPASTPREQDARARHMGKRSAAGVRRDRTPEQADAFGRDDQQHARCAGAAGC